MNAAELAAAKKLPPPETRRALRLAAGVTLQELAGLLGVTISAVSKYELGHRDPRGPLRLKYAQTLRDLQRHLAQVE